MFFRLDKTGPTIRNMAGGKFRRRFNHPYRHVNDLISRARELVRYAQHICVVHDIRGNFHRLPTAQYVIRSLLSAWHFQTSLVLYDGQDLSTRPTYFEIRTRNYGAYISFLRTLRYQFPAAVIFISYLTLFFRIKRTRVYKSITYLYIFNIIISTKI